MTHTMNPYALITNDPLATTALNPSLYRTLVRVFGQVTIANEGQGFHGHVLPTADGRQSLQVRAAGEYYRVCCPWCHDTRKRLWINHYYGQMGPDNRPLIHLAHCFNDDCLASWERRKALADRLLGMPNARERREPAPLNPASDDGPTAAFEPPGDVQPLASLPPSHPAVRYMVSRRYTPEMVQAFEIGYIVRAVPKYRLAQDRIYFPIRMHGQLVGWQTRYIGDIDWKAAGIPKYYSLPGFKKSRVLYNFDTAVNYAFVVPVEGPADAQRAGGPAVALLGKTLSATQRSLLIQHWPGKPIVFVLDPEAKEEMQGIVFDLAMERRTAPVIAVELPGTADPGDWETGPLWDFIYRRAADQRVFLR